MKGKASQEKMIRVDVDWFFTRENLEKFSDEELESILRELQEIEKEKRGGQGGGAAESVNDFETPEFAIY